MIGGIGGPRRPAWWLDNRQLYFDVVGDAPNSVVYNDGVQDLLVWVPGPLEGGVPVLWQRRPRMPQESRPRSSAGYLLKALQKHPRLKPPPRSSRRRPSSSPNRRWLPVQCSSRRASLIVLSPTDDHVIDVSRPTGAV